MAKVAPKKAAPAIPAFAMIRAPGGWQALEFAVNDDGTAELVWQSEPNVRDLARSEFRTRVGKHWHRLEGGK